MHDIYHGDCPNLTTAYTSIAHENRFYDKVKKSENLKFKEKSQNSKKSEAIES